MAVKKYLGKVESINNLTEKVMLVRLVFEERVDCLAGQYASVKVSDSGERRSYSVASLSNQISENGNSFIDLLIDVSPMGLGSRFFLGLKIGDVVEILGFMGRFLVEERLMSKKDLVFVATGTGIAPVKPMIEDVLRNKKYIGKVNLVWGMRQETELYWMEEMKNLENEFVNFRMWLVLSQPKDGWSGKKGHVGEVLEELDLDWEGAAVFLCGSPDMVEEVSKKLLFKGVETANIIHEKYS